MRTGKDRIRVLEIMEATTGGTRRHLVDLATRLDKERFSVSVLCSTLRDGTFAADVGRMRESGIDVNVIRMRREVSPVSDLRAFLAICRHVKRGRYDIVHTHSSKAGILGRMAARLAGATRIVHSPHVFAFEMDVCCATRRFYVLLERLAGGITDKLICVSGSERDLAVGKRIVPASRTVIVHNGVEPAPGNIAGRGAMRKAMGLIPGTFVVGSVGRLTRQKGYRYLVEAARTVVRDMPNTAFVLVGEGDEKPALLRLVSELGLTGSFVFVDPGASDRRRHAAFDVFVLPSLWEGLPYALLDAMSAGLPVVASDVGGVRDVVEPERTGLLVSPRDSAELARSIIRLAGDPELRARLAESAAAEIGRGYTLDGMVGAVERVYECRIDAARGRTYKRERGEHS